MKRLTTIVALILLSTVGCIGAESHPGDEDPDADATIAQPDAGGMGGALGTVGTGGAPVVAGTGGATGAAGAMDGTGGAGTGGATGTTGWPTCPRIGTAQQSSICPGSMTGADGQPHRCTRCISGYDVSVLPCMGALLCVADCNDCV